MKSIFSDERQILTTPYGDTFVRKLGRGPLLIVVHGGPGFDHSYMVKALEPLAQNRTLVFYDQIGCGQSVASSQNLKPIDIFKQLRWLSHYLSNGERIDVIAHSWGTLVLIGALIDDRMIAEPIAQFGECLLINPVPISAANYKLCTNNLLARIPLIERLQLIRLALFETDGAIIMERLLPYYVRDVKSLPARPISA